MIILFLSGVQIKYFVIYQDLDMRIVAFLRRVLNGAAKNMRTRVICLINKLPGKTKGKNFFEVGSNLDPRKMVKALKIRAFTHPTSTRGGT